MGMEPRPSFVEVWPIAADQAGLWLLAPDAWQSGPVMSDNEPHSEVDFLLSEYAVDTLTRLEHSTSWRTDGQILVLTYVACIALPVDALDVKDAFPDALPISGHLLDEDAAGQAEAGPATAPPTPRYLDVLMHAVRHLRFLLDYDDVAARELDALGFTPHLRTLAPALAGMYRDPSLAS